MVMMMIMIDNVMTMTYIMTLFTIINNQDDNCDFLTRILGHGNGNNCKLNNWQDVDMSKGVVRDGDYDNDDKNDDNHDGHFDLERPLASLKVNFRSFGQKEASEKSGRLVVNVKAKVQPGLI